MTGIGKTRNQRRRYSFPKVKAVRLLIQIWVKSWIGLLIHMLYWSLKTQMLLCTFPTQQHSFLVCKLHQIKCLINKRGIETHTYPHDIFQREKYRIIIGLCYVRLDFQSKHNYLIYLHSIEYFYKISVLTNNVLCWVSDETSFKTVNINWIRDSSRSSQYIVKLPTLGWFESDVDTWKLRRLVKLHTNELYVILQ